MKLTSIELHPKNSSEAALLSFRDPGRKNPYMVKAIDGLDADEIVSRFYGGSGSSSVRFFQLAQLKRTIVMRISLNPRSSIQETFSGLRDKIYKMIASSRTGTIDIQFKNGETVVAVLSGFVTKLEAGLFNKEQEIQISIRCKEPTLRAPDRLSIPLTELDPSLTIINDSLSTSPHGFLFGLQVLAATPTITITDPDDDTWSFAVAPFGGFLVGDVLYFSSELNNKELYLLRGDNTFYLADKIAPGSVWPIMFPGVNKISVTPAASVSWTSLLHYPTYWGV